MRRHPSQGLLVSRLTPAQLRLLQQIPAHADPSGSLEAESRLFQNPVRSDADDPEEDEITADWHEHVIPDLETEFSRQLDCVSEDLRRARREQPAAATDASPQPPKSHANDGEESHNDDDGDDSGSGGDTKNEYTDEPPGDFYEFAIPFDHVESWYGALNQARLVMQERYQFPEIESLDTIFELLQSENIKPYLTSRFYVEIQAALLEMAMDRM